MASSDPSSTSRRKAKRIPVPTVKKLFLSKEEANRMMSSKYESIDKDNHHNFLKHFVELRPENIQGALFRRHSTDRESRKRAPVTAQRSLSGSLDSAYHNHLYLFREFPDSKSGSVYGSNDPICDRLDFDELEKDEDLTYVKFFQFYRCYDLIPISAKLVVFDTALLVKKAFYALVSNGVRAAPLWDSANHRFVGMLTITDFINILRTYYKSPYVKMDELEEQKLETWRNVLKENAPSLVSIEPDSSLLDCIKVLIHNKVHRLPVIDPETGNVLYIMTHKRILRFLFLYYYDLPQPKYLHRTIEELQIGTYDNIAVTTMNTPLIRVLQMFIERRVSALPIVDEKGRVIDIYAKFDVFNLAAEKTCSNLDIPLKKALEHRPHFVEGVVKCKLGDTFHAVLEKIVKAEVHRIVVVDDKNVVIGMISLSDILKFLALRPLEDDKEPENDIILEETEERSEKQTRLKRGKTIDHSGGIDEGAIGAEDEAEIESCQLPTIQLSLVDDHGANQ